MKMNLNEFIEQNKIGKDVFIAIHNKQDIWIICDTVSSGKLVDFLQMNVIDHVNMSKCLVRVTLDYDANLTPAGIRQKEEALIHVKVKTHDVDDESDTTDDESTKKRKRSKKK